VNKYIVELVKLSKTDKQIDGYQPKIDEANKKIKKAEEKLGDAKEEFEGLSKQIADNEKKVTSFEEQIKLLADQLVNNAKKSKSIANEKEMKALGIEEDIAKEKMGFANEEIARLQGVNEKRTAELKELQVKIDQLAQDAQSAVNAAQGTKDEIQKAKLELFNLREEIIRGLDKKMLAFYEKIRIWAGNSAVAPVKKQACYGCYMKINDKTYADVIKAEEIVTCPHCGRILHVETDPEA
jgi:uncharacterized protein